MKKQLLFMIFIASVAMNFIACSSSDETANEQTQLKLSAGITAQKEPYNIGEWGSTVNIGNIDVNFAKENVYKPKAEVTRAPADDNNWVGMSNRNIAVQIGNNVVANSLIEANGNIVLPDTYYFTGTADVPVKSWYPYSASLTSFSVKADQTLYADYESSDLMYASMNVNQNSPNGRLVYSHKTAKIIFNVTVNNSNYLYDRVVSEISLSNVYMSGSVLNGNITANGSKGSVKMYNVVGSSTNSSFVTTATFEACIIPQTTAISYSINYGSGTYNGTLASKTLNAGGSYVVNVNLNVTKYVDLGLPSGAKWSRICVDANTATELGGYYAWGATSTYSSGTGTEWQEDLDITPSSGHDVAYNKWGSGWRLPTTTEGQELIDNCTFTWKIYDGAQGCLVTSNINNNSFFIPSAGEVYTDDVVKNIEVVFLWFSNHVPRSATEDRFLNSGVQLSWYGVCNSGNPILKMSIYADRKDGFNIKAVYKP